MSTSLSRLFSLAILLSAITARVSQARPANGNTEKTAVFLSPKIELLPGSVSNKYYYDIDFPRGHIALKSFNAEVVDEAGNPVPLLETYLHHWIAVRYYQLKGVNATKYNDNTGFYKSNRIMARNAGLCDRGLSQFFGLGSETRKTATRVPDPYAIDFGNPSEIPEGYEEIWMLNVHAIDTRGVDERLGCIECRCDLYNVTIDEYGRPLRPDYVGGLNCCYDEQQCRLREGVLGVKRSLYMRYTVTWLDWDSSIVPVKVYLLDVTDTWKKLDESTGTSAKHDCKIEYQVESCANEFASDVCTDTRRVSLSLPSGGDVVYAVAHQHTGGIGSALYGEDGRAICSSFPTYGKGKEAGNEAGYIVGMSTCYPQPGSVKVSAGEILTLESNYSSSRRHTGVMGLFYLLVAPDSSKFTPLSRAPVDMHKTMSIPIWGGVLFGVVIVVAAAVVAYQRRSIRNDGYEPMVM